MNRFPRRILPLAALLTLTISPAALATRHASSPEQRTLEIARTLRPIPDEEWQNIAGDRATEGYAIIKGDTLYDISQRLFGDPKYWPKIWAINNHSILNPHLIYPGNTISFMAGTGSALPAVAVTAQNDATPGTPASPLEPGDDAATDYRPSAVGRSQEWRYMPHQRWESNVSNVPSTVDRLGFDTSSKIRFKAPTLTELPSIAATERLEFKGHLFAASSERQYLFVGDTVYVQADQALTIGQTYAITKEPGNLTASHSDRPGLSYRILGKVKIVAMRDKLYLGEVEALSDVVSRGVWLMPLPEKIAEPQMIAASQPLEGTMLFDEEVVEANHASQHRWVFIDRGSEDGVRPGMIFRHYQHDDAITGERITDADVLPEADFEIIYCTAHYSTARVLRSDRMIDSGLSVRALTNLDDLKHFDAIKMKDLFGSAPVESGLPKPGSKEPSKPSSPTSSPIVTPSSTDEPKSLDSTTVPGAADLPPPADISPAEAPPPEQTAPTEKSAPPPADVPPPPADTEIQPEAAPPPPTEAAPSTGGETLPPPPEVAPMPDLPATPIQDPAP